MKTTLQSQLLAEPSQYAALVNPMQAFNTACNYRAEVAYRDRCASRIKLQAQVYEHVRTTLGRSSQMAVRAIAKGVESYKRDKTKQCFFRPTGAVVYDQRILSFKGLEKASLLSLQGRVLIPMQMGHYPRVPWHRAKGQADWALVANVF